jgi:hypothetical protein
VTGYEDDDFHLRSREYTGGHVSTAPMGVTTGVRTADTVAGQISVLSAVNLMARSPTRRLVIAVPESPLLISSPEGGTTLREACIRLATAVRSSLVVEVADIVPEEMDCMGIGDDAPSGTVFVGANRWTAFVADHPVGITEENSSMLGACLAVVLAHGHLFRRALGLSSKVPWSMSLWSLEETSEQTGPPDVDAVDVGVVWLVGAGAVGSCLAWWLRMFGVVGEWHVIDDDVIKHLNLDRSLAYFDADVNEEPGMATYKSDVVARILPGAEAHRMRWDKFRELDLPMPDVIIPIANEDSVRAKVAYLGHPAVIHATTGRVWTSELHRHLPFSDGCLSCRLPTETPRFACAEGEVPSQNEGARNDASLPFLSAGAGLLLLAGLIQLQEGEWANHDRNHWRIHFDGPVIKSSRWPCSQYCETWSLPEVRARNYATTRWFALDQQAALFVADTATSQKKDREM